MSAVIAIVCSDIHLSLNPPLARCKEPDWFAAMKRPLDEVKRLAKDYGCPVLCAGDVFDHWKAPPELVNFAIDALPMMYTIPGQHDLPLHSLENIRKSAYWTLVKAGRIVNVPDFGIAIRNPELGRDFSLYGFPWGVPIKPPAYNEETIKGRPRVALVHEYTWTTGAGYVGAPANAFVDTDPGKYKGYNAVVIGDNHIPFDSQRVDTRIFNCGGFYRRKSDDRHKPRVGLLSSDGTIANHYLDTSKDVFIPTSETLGVQNSGLEAFLNQIKDLQGSTLDYADAIMQAIKINRTNPEVVQLILTALGHKI